MIKINERFSIKADEYQFVLVENKTVKKEDSKNFGAVREEVVGYYGNMEHLLRSLSKLLFREEIIDNDMSLSESIERYKEITEKVSLAYSSHNESI